MIFVIATPSYHRVMHCLLTALSALTLGVKVKLFFTYGGILRLRRGMTDEVWEETEEWIRGRLREGVRRESVNRISDLLEDLYSLGAEIYACPSAMAFHNISREELVDCITGVRGITPLISSAISGGEDFTIVYV